MAAREFPIYWFEAIVPQTRHDLSTGLVDRQHRILDPVHNENLRTRRGLAGGRKSGREGEYMPPFWVGLLLMLFFGLYLRWLPVSGLGDDFADRARHLFLPSATIALFLAPILVQSLRSAMLEVMTSDYIEVARAKGLTPRRILLKHVLRNALIPVITILAVNIGWLLSGAVIVEYVFSYPGLGSLLVRAVSYRDYPIIQGLSIVFGVLVIFVNLMADLSYILVDRRVLKK